MLYTGSARNGANDAATGAVSKFSGGGPYGQVALGLKVNPQGRLRMAGGAQGTVGILNPDDRTFKVLQTPRSPSPPSTTS
ncbi:hypothetical protein [Deinococcus navajonensis]|uniref:Uncharacterized protein n=1 Tax=Deinococcus navajonensis TaxID=309884 RepID=A0ABV8XKB1_9DEIO